MKFIYKVIIIKLIIYIKGVKMFDFNDTAEHIMKIGNNYISDNDVYENSFQTKNHNIEEIEYFKKRNFFPPDLQHILNAINVLPSGLCRNDSEVVLNAVINRQQWALKMFDSSPKFPVGMLYGDYYQLGNFDECISIKKMSTYLNRNIQGQYCLADISLQSDQTGRLNGHFYEHELPSRLVRNNTLHWAVCVPSSCSAKKVEQFLNELFEIAINYKVVTIQIPEINCHFEQEMPFTMLEIMYGCLVGFFLVIVILATIYHLIFIYRKTKSLNYNVNIQGSNDSTIYHEIVMSFSAIRSIKKLLSVKTSDLNLNCIFGIKCISMLLIIASHTLLFLIGGPVTNEAFYTKAVTKPQNAILLNNALFVDTFLLISGFLLCRLLLLEFEKRNGRINIFALYAARYIRLTPAYFAIIGLYCTVLKRLDNGPLWDHRITVERDRCLKSWWTNLLYINNYLNTDNICMFQSWYLAVDTQLFILAPAVIYPLWKWPKVGQAILGIVTLVVTTIPFIITYLYKLDPTQMTFPSEITDITTNYYFHFAYIKTHMKAIPYTIGLTTGYLVHKLQLSSIKISNNIVLASWILALIFGVSSIFSITRFYISEYGSFEASAYSTLHKISWSICVSWIIIACITDKAGPIKNFLSWVPFAIFSRLTYCAYLVNGLIGLHSIGTLRVPTYLSVYHLTSTALTHCILTFIMGFILCILFESPIYNLEKCFNIGYQVKKTNPQTAT